MFEEWRPVVGFPAYAVSSLGRVKRVKATARYRATGKALASKPNANGYIMVSLYEAGQRQSRSVHAIVCEAFHGPCPSSDHQVAHSDGIRNHNQASNLRWALRHENMADKITHGTVVCGDRHFSRTSPERLARGERNGGGGKLTEADVRMIRADSRVHREIASEYRVAKSMVGMIKRREVWKHVL